MAISCAQLVCLCIMCARKNKMAIYVLNTSKQDVNFGLGLNETK